MIESEQVVNALEMKCVSIEGNLKSERSNMEHLKKILKRVQRESEDNEWQLQEQLAHSNSLILQEKEKSEQLISKVDELQNKIIEVETFLNGRDGQLALQLEEELAVSKLKIAELEAEQDSLQLKLSKINRPLKEKN